MQDTKKREAYSLLRNSSEDIRRDHLPELSPQRHRLLRVSAYVHLILLIFNAVVGIFLLQKLIEASARPHLIHSPVNPILHTREEYWNLNLGQRTPFTKAPNKEVDALWDSITAPPGKVGTIKVSKHDLDKAGLQSVQVADGSGYLATVDVFHQLHCLDRLRRQIYNSTYQISPNKNPLWEDHIAHCIDSIRLSLQCSADVSLITWKWLKDYANPWPDFRGKHECRNWDNILEWAKDRMYDPKTQGTLVHPELGPLEDIDSKWFENPLRDGRRVEYIDTD